MYKKETVGEGVGVAVGPERKGGERRRGGEGVSLARWSGHIVRYPPNEPPPPPRPYTEPHHSVMLLPSCLFHYLP